MFSRHTKTSHVLLGQKCDNDITRRGNNKCRKKFLLEYELYCNSITLKTSLISLKNMTVHIHPQCCHFSFWYARFSVQKQHKWILGVGDIIFYILWKILLVDDINIWNIFGVAYEIRNLNVERNSFYFWCCCYNQGNIDW